MFTATLEINRVCHMGNVWDLVHITDEHGQEVDTLWVPPTEELAPYREVAARCGWEWCGEDGPIVRSL